MRLPLLVPMLLGASALAQAPEGQWPPVDPEAKSEELVKLLSTPIIIASKNKETASTAPSFVSVITAETIQRFGYRDIWEALKSVPGVTVYDSHQQRPRVVFRGETSLQNEKVLFLVNGQVTNTFSLSMAFLPWGRLPIENVAAIEVIRGPNAALYGAGAFSGLINIRTKSVQDGVGGDFMLRRGGDQYVASSVSYAETLGDFGFSAFYNHTRDDGQNLFLPADGQTLLAPNIAQLGVCPATLKDPQTTDLATLNLTYQGLRVNAMWYSWHNSGYVPYNVASLPNDPLNTDDTVVKQIDATWDFNLSPTFTLTPSLTHTDIRTGIVAPIRNGFSVMGYTPGYYGGPHFFFKRDGAQVFGRWVPSHEHNLIFGVIHALERPYDNFDRSTYLLSGAPNPYGFNDLKSAICGTGIMRDLAFVIQYTWKLHPALSLLAGVRHDRFSGDFRPDARETSYGKKEFAYSTTKPRIAVVYKPFSDTTLKATFNQAMLIPTINNWTQNTPVLRGNPSLVPQNIRMIELGGSQTFDRGLLSLNFYHGRISQLITSMKPLEAQKAFYVNQGEEAQKGLELEGKLYMDTGLTLGFN